MNAAAPSITVDADFGRTQVKTQKFTTTTSPTTVEGTIFRCTTTHHIVTDTVHTVTTIIKIPTI